MLLLYTLFMDETNRKDLTFAAGLPLFFFRPVHVWLLHSTMSLLSGTTETTPASRAAICGLQQLRELFIPECMAYNAHSRLLSEWASILNTVLFLWVCRIVECPTS